MNFIFNIIIETGDFFIMQTDIPSENVIYQTINSAANDKIKYLKKLVNSSSFRKQENKFIIQTEKITNHGFNNNINIEEIFFTKKEYEKNRDSIIIYKNSGISCYLISDLCAEKISDFKTPQGFFALCLIEDLSLGIDKNQDMNMIIKKDKNLKRVIALDNLQDPGNLGTIIRTALAFGFDGVLLGNNCADLYSSKVIRSTMGAFFGFNVTCCDDLAKALNIFKENGFCVYGTLLDNEAKQLGTFEFAQKSVIVIGNEGHGICKEVEDVCNEKVYIPMKPFKGQIQSLNASSAASVIMWDCVRDAE